MTEERREYNRRWYEANRERSIARVKAWGDANKERKNENSRRWREENPGKEEESRLKKKYGITRDDFDKMVDAQVGLCAVCLRKPLRLHVDHCHETGRIRGLLCGSCNRAIGLLGDCPESLRRAIDYLG